MAGRRRDNQAISPSSNKRFKRFHRDTDGGNNYIHTNCAVNLSDDILEYIFSLLPISYAVQTGVLSVRFKNSWIYNRYLWFDEDFARSRSRSEFIEIVNRVLNHHAAVNIQSFRLYFNPNNVENLVEYWIRKATIKGVEELDLDFGPGIEAFKLNSDLLEVESIRVLKLSSCKIDLPPTLNGLCFLETLVLRKASVSPSFFDALFCNCLLLHTLDLARCSKIYRLRISAQNLKRFKFLKVGNCSDIFLIHIDAPTLWTLRYRGKAPSFQFEGRMSQLKDVILNFTPTRSILPPYRMRNFVPILAHARVLTATGTFLEGLTPSWTEEQFVANQFCFSNLKEFQLLMEGASYCNPYDIAFFLESCPSLERVFIDLTEFSFESGLYWECHGEQRFQQCNRPFHHLKHVKLKEFKFQTQEVKLVKYFLERAPFLETLVLVNSKKMSSKICAQHAQIHERYFGQCRASPNAKIVRYDHLNDGSFIYPEHSEIWY